MVSGAIDSRETMQRAWPGIPPSSLRADEQISRSPRWEVLQVRHSTVLAPCRIAVAHHGLTLSAFNLSPQSPSHTSKLSYIT